MRLLVMGQQAFGKAALDKFLGTESTRWSASIAPLTRGQTDRSTQGGSNSCGHSGAPATRLQESGDARGDAFFRGGSDDHGIRDAVRARGGAQHSCSGFYLLSPVALAAAPRAQFDQLADHHGSNKDRLFLVLPHDGLDEGDILLQRECSIGPDDTLGDVYFKKIFPAAIDSITEVCDLFRSGNPPRVPAGREQGNLRELVP